VAQAVTQRAKAIAYLKDRWWPPGKIQRLLDEANQKGRDPLVLARTVTLAEALANTRQSAQEYRVDLARHPGRLPRRQQ
jgi:hypothetical protein